MTHRSSSTGAPWGARLGAAVTAGILAHRPESPCGDGESGQATTEYALVLLAAAFVGLLVVGWATTGAGAATVGRLFDRIMRAVIEKT
jgi:hypothetical protein